MLRRILSQVFNYDKKSSRVEAQSTGRPRFAKQPLDNPETGTDKSSGSVHSGSDEVKVYPFPDPWDGDWNDAVINWAYWYENKQCKSKGQESTEVGTPNVDRDSRCPPRGY